MSLAFIVCVERGNLEDQAKLLCRSIRRYGGRFRDAPIYTFQPRRGTAISDQTLTVLEGLSVVHNTEQLNTAFPDYGIGNKIFVCARAEELLGEEVLVFLDTDTIIVAEPVALDLPPGIDAAVRIAYSRWLSSTGPGDPRDPYWPNVYQICGLEKELFLENELAPFHESGKKLRAYFSAGLVAVRRRAGLFRQWKADFLRLIEAGHIPASTGIRRMDEVALVAMVARAFDRVQLLDSRYNYLIYKRPEPHFPRRTAQFEQLIHVHYRFWFNHPDFFRLVRPPFDPDSEIVQWLDEYLPFEPFLDRPVPGSILVPTP